MTPPLPVCSHDKVLVNSLKYDAMFIIIQKSQTRVSTSCSFLDVSVLDRLIYRLFWSKLCDYFCSSHTHKHSAAVFNTHTQIFILSLT